MARARRRQEYLDEISPERARDAFEDEGADGLAAQRAEVKRLHEQKLTFLAKIGIDFLAAQLKMSAADFLERFDPENTTAERARVNWTQLARDAQGPTRVGDRLRVAANGGQGWVQLLRASGLVNVDLLCTREGERGFHRRRSANYKITVGSRKISMAQKPTTARVQELFQKEWVETGLVSVGAQAAAAAGGRGMGGHRGERRAHARARRGERGEAARRRARGAACARPGGVRAGRRACGAAGGAAAHLRVSAASFSTPHGEARWARRPRGRTSCVCVSAHR